VATPWCARDPDVIENHNLHGFDLPFLRERARRLGVPLALGRTTARACAQAAARSASVRRRGRRAIACRYTMPGAS
jgi:DNA polymerase I